MQLILILFFYIPLLYCYSNQKWNTIRTLLQNNKISTTNKNKIRTMIYNDHIYNWTLKNSWEFKRKFNKQIKIRNMDIYELNYYAIKGLHYCCKKYTGEKPFYIYSKPIIYYNLLYSITESHDINNRLPHRLLNNKKWKQNNQKILNTHLKPAIYTSNLLKELYTNHDYGKEKQQQIQQINDIIKSMDGHDRLLFYYRYDIISLKKKRSIKHLTELMCCSSETIRLDLLRIKQNITNQLRHLNSFNSDDTFCYI